MPFLPAMHTMSIKKAVSPTKSIRAWQRMLSGRRLDLLDPSPLDIEIEDIAHGLARVARWNGQTHGAHIFSVAQHTLLVEAVMRAQSPRIDRRVRLAAMLHDAPEYVIGDMISPFKAVIGDSYKDVEHRILGAILLRYGLPAKPSAGLAALVKKADRASAYFEATALAGFELGEAHKIFGRPDFRPRGIDGLLEPIPSNEAEQRFLARFRAIEEEL